MWSLLAAKICHFCSYHACYSLPKSQGVTYKALALRAAAAVLQYFICVCSLVSLSISGVPLLCHSLMSPLRFCVCECVSLFFRGASISDTSQSGMIVRYVQGGFFTGSALKVLSVEDGKIPTKGVSQRKWQVST